MALSIQDTWSQGHLRQENEHNRTAFGERRGRNFYHKTVCSDEFYH